MKVFVVFSVVLIHSAFAMNVATSDAEKIPMEALFSDHIPQYLPGMNLTTGELKLFAGHTINLLKAKCPAVPQERLSLLNKYITKLISRSRPVPGSSLPFRGLLNSISTCTTTQITQEEKEKRASSYMQYFLTPFKRISNYFGGAKQEDKAVKPTSTGESPAVEHSGNNAVAQPATINDNEQTTDSPNDGPVFHIFYTTTGDSDSINEDGSSTNPMGWLAGIINAFRSIMSGLFRAPVDETSAAGPVVPTVAEQVKPSVETPAAIPTAAPGAPRVRRDVAAAAPVAKSEINSPPGTSTAITGKQAFTQLVDSMCRVYCRECMDKEETRHFKAAAKELLHLILSDSTGVELASKHFLEPAFLTALNEC